MADHARKSPEESLQPSVLRELCQLLSQPNKRKPLLALLDGLDLVKSGVYSAVEVAEEARSVDGSDNGSPHISGNTSQDDLSMVDSAIDLVTITTDLTEISIGTPRNESKVQQPLEVTALHLAASMGLTKVAAMLLNDTSDIDAMDETGKTPLAVAMEKGFEKAVELLINSGAHVDLRTEHGRGILLFAAERNWSGVGGMIVERARNQSHNDTHVSLLIATYSNDPGLQHAIERVTESPDNQDTHILETAMFLSVELNHLSAVEAFLQAGVDVNSRDTIGQAALHRATRCESETMIRALLAHGADIELKDDSDKTAWRANLWNTKKDILNLLLEFGADPNTRGAGGVGELYSAAAGGETEMVRYLLESGADPSIQTIFDWAPLHWAAHNGHIECVRLLLQAGADVNPNSDQNRTPLDMAIGANQDAIAELLVASGAKTKTELGQQPSSNTTHRRPVQDLARDEKETAAKISPAKVTLHFDQPLDEGYTWGQFIYIPEDIEATDYLPYQISHRLTSVTPFISIRVAQHRVAMVEYPLAPEKFPRQGVLYDIVRMDVDYPELKLRGNPSSPLGGDITIRRTWTGNWQVHHVDDSGARRMLFRTVESNWLSANVKTCRWNDEHGVFLATTGVSTITFESSLDRNLLDVLASCWVAKLWSENLTHQEQETETTV